MKEQTIEQLRKDFPSGTRVRLISMNDPVGVPPGTEGDVFYVDAIGQIHVKWDTGSTLALHIDVDRFDKI